MHRTPAILTALALTLASTATAAAATPPARPPAATQQLEVTLTAVAGAMAPTTGTAGPGGTVWIGERAGLVRILEEGGLSEPVLDLTAEISTDGEGGLLGMVFDEAFEHFYVSFTDLNGDTTIVEYPVVDGELQLESRRTLLTQEQPFSNHNGGHLAIGPDGMLYIGLGDGGSSGDPLDNGQNLDTLLGKLLRIDPTGGEAEGEPYAIPPDNPFVTDPAARDEIWAYGLRNPWRFSFDAATGDLWIADVGQNTREEINWADAASPGGENYGWNRMEGTLPFNGEEPADHVPPVFEYDNDGARCAITGGHVYRGDAIPQLHGSYLFSDFCDGTIRALQIQDGAIVGELNLGVNAGNVVSFVQGPDLELYALNIGLIIGTVFRIDPVPVTD
ncbi:MAG TPA: PQQ-dependent sugar dehydrogenase [Natronosporangium sp.]